MVFLVLLSCASILIIPLAEKVSVFVGAVVIFPLVLLGTPPTVEISGQVTGTW